MGEISTILEPISQRGKQFPRLATRADRRRYRADGCPRSRARRLRPEGSWKVSGERIFTGGSTPAVALGHGRRIVLAVGVLVGLAAVFLLTFGIGGASVAQAQGTTISAKALNDHGCSSSEWAFVINQINAEANAPASITVQWANGATEVVPLTMFTGKVGHYVTTSNLDSTVVSATTEIYAGWSGQFNLSHGPCGGSSPSPSPSPSPSASPSKPS
jgi:hypothetical protein